MSSLVVVNQGEEAMLDLVLAVGYTLRLYKNDVIAGLTPDQIDALTQAAFTEADFPGYAASAITGGTWTTTQGNPTMGTNTERQFTRSSTGTAQLIRGYYYTRTSDGALQGFEHFEAPISVEFINDRIDITPRVSLEDSGGNVLPTGLIAPYGAAAAPTGWLLCDGAAVSRTTFAALFAVIGTTYGVGDGSTTFNVPDLRQRFPLGKAAAGTGATLGGTGGTIDHVHGLDTATSHAKLTIAAATDNNLWIRRKSATSWTATIEGDAGSAVSDTTVNATGVELGGSSDSGNPPFLATQFIVKT
jgi:microcystin-dependent protein